MIKSVKSGANGIRVIWSRVDAAPRYRIYFRTSTKNQWKKFDDTEKTEVVVYPEQSNILLYFKICCIDNNGKIVSRSKSSKGIRYIAAPEITAARWLSGGYIGLKWKVPAGVSAESVTFHVYRAVSGSKWIKIAETKNTKYYDKKVKKGTVYTYMIRSVSKEGKNIGCYDGDGKAVLIPLKSLKNYKGFAWLMTEKQMKKAYAEAARFVENLGKMNRINQVWYVCAWITGMARSGEIQYDQTAPHYNDPYGFLILKRGSCAGCTRTVGMCLNMLGISYDHVNENKNCHQWARVRIGKKYYICDPFGNYFLEERAPYEHPYEILFRQ